MLDRALQLDDHECHDLFAAIFPHGLDGADVFAELAPAGWEASPLRAVAHPTPEQLYEESLRWHAGMQSLAAARGKDSRDSIGKPPTLEEIRSEHKPLPVDAPREMRDLVGMCLWDVFSDNHHVLAPDGRAADLGSHRAAAGFLAEVVNRSLGIAPGAGEEQEIARLKRLIGRGPEDFESMIADFAAERDNAARVYDYMDFYLGTRMVADRADLTPVYRLIFQRLRQAECDWRYSFPRIYLADLRSLRGAICEDESEPAEYDPSAALAAEQAEQVRDAEIAEVRAGLDESYREAIEAAQDAPPPPTVAAYRAVYGDFPEGWPPDALED